MSTVSESRQARSSSRLRRIWALMRKESFEVVRDPSSIALGIVMPVMLVLLFGYGLHWCTGAFIAAAQITQTFKALLVKPNLRPASRRAGRLQLLGPFPQHLTVEFDQ